METKSKKKLKTFSERIPEAQDSYSDVEAAKSYIEASRSGPVALQERLFVRQILKKYGHNTYLKVLDLGTGPGWIPTLLAKARPQWKIVALDSSSAMLDYARKYSRLQNVVINWIQGQAEKTNLDRNQFDLVISHYAFHEFSNPKKVLIEMARVARHGGSIFMADLKRPSSWIMTLAKLWGIFYSKAMREQYQSSLRASYTVREVREILMGIGMKGNVSKSFGVNLHIEVKILKSKRPDPKGFHPKGSQFNFSRAYSRNLGLITETEMDRLSHACVAIPGLGGVGGAHVEILARQGIGRFRLADFDSFDLSNFNRQFGATVETLNKPKLDVLSNRIKNINPNAIVKGFPNGISQYNLVQFLEGVDVIVDSLDFFAIEIRRQLFREAFIRKIPVVSAGPYGFGATLFVVLPNGMSFDDFFGITDEMPYSEKILRFAVGCSPKGFHLSYMDPAFINFHTKRAPSSSIGVAMCAAVGGMQTIKLLLGVEGVRALPHYAQYDAKREIWYRGYLPGGLRNPLQNLKMRIFRRRFSHLFKPDSHPNPSKQGDPPN